MYSPRMNKPFTTENLGGLQAVEHGLVAKGDVLVRGYGGQRVQRRPERREIRENVMEMAARGYTVYRAIPVVGTLQNYELAQQEKRRKEKA